MGGGGGGPSGGVEEKAALIAQINANTELTPEDKAAYLAKAKGIQENNIVDAFEGGLMDAKRSQTVDEVNALQGDYQTKAAARSKQLLQNRTKLSAELEALQKVPGSRQTTKLTALMASPTPSLIPGQS